MVALNANAAAGVASLLFAVRSMAHAVSQPMLHLRVLNPYVADACTDSAARGVAISRQRAPIARGRHLDGLAAAGTSAFAYQGDS